MPKYEALSETWRHLALWREKIFAGYLAVLAALGLAFSHSPSVAIRTAILGGGIVVSVVFWILDYRNTQLINASQAAAAALEGEGGPSRALNALRFGPRRTWLTYALAIDLLVGAVIAAAGGGVVVYAIRLYESQRSYLWLGLAPVVGLLLTWRLQAVRTAQWRREREQWTALASGLASGAGTHERGAVEQGDAADER